jgi:hypothetical protein
VLVPTLIGVAVVVLVIVIVLIVVLVRRTADSVHITNEQFDDADRRLGASVPLDDAERDRARHDFQEWLVENEDPGDSDGGLDE